MSRIINSIKRVRRKPVHGEEEFHDTPPPPYSYSENASVSTTALKPVAEYFENQAVEDIHLNQTTKHETTPVYIRQKGRGSTENAAARTSFQENSVPDGERRRWSTASSSVSRGSQENAESEREHRRWSTANDLADRGVHENSISERGHTEDMIAERRIEPSYLENQRWGRVYDQETSKPPDPTLLPELPVPPPPHLPPVQRSAPPPPPPPKVPPKVARIPAHPELPAEPRTIFIPRPAATSSEAVEATSPKIAKTIVTKIEDFVVEEGQEEAGEDDEGNASDASHDSYFEEKLQTWQRLKEADAIDKHKLDLTSAAEKQDWPLAFHLALELVESTEKRGDNIPIEWHMDLAKFALNAGILPSLETTEKILSVIEEKDGQEEQVVSTEIQMQAILLQGVIATKKQDTKASLRWFQKGSRFARRHELTAHMHDCYWVLRRMHHDLGETEEMELYANLLPPDCRPPGGLRPKTSPLGTLRPTAFVDSVITDLIKRHKCLRLLDELCSRKDVADNDAIREEYRKILSYVSILVLPSPAKTFAGICSMREATVYKRVLAADLIFEPPRTIRDTIQFKDYFFHRVLTEDASAGHKIFSEPEAQIHARLALRLLEILTKYLKTDICDIKTRGRARTLMDSSEIVRGLPLYGAREYACKFWLHHFRKGKLSLATSIEVQKFLQEHWLHWIEAMGLIEGVNEATNMASILRAMAATERLLGLSATVADNIDRMAKFLERYKETIRAYPLQVYYLNTFFDFEENQSAPKKVVNISVHDARDQDATFKRMEEGYKEFLKVMQPGSNTDQHVAFSSDLTKVAYNVLNSTIVIVQDLMTMADGIILDHGQSKVYQIKFSPNVGQDNILAIVTDDWKVMLWDTSKRTLSRTIIPDFHKFHLRVWFSGDGKLIALTTGRAQTTVWETDTGNQTWWTIEAKNEVVSIAFSPDGETLAEIDTGAYVKSIRSWKSKTVVDLDVWYNIHMKIASLHFLRDNQLLICAQYKGTFVRRPNGSKAYTLDEGDSTGFITTAAVSQDLDRIALVRDKGPIKIFEAKAGQSIQTFMRLAQVRSETTLAATFFPSGDRLITVSKEMGMRMWDLKMDVQVKDGWVTRGDERLLWIPPNYHARVVSAVSSNCVVLTHPSGRFLELQFDLERKPQEAGTGGAYGLVKTVFSYLPSVPGYSYLPSFPSRASFGFS